MEENAVSTEMQENKQASISNSIKNGKIFKDVKKSDVDKVAKEISEIIKGKNNEKVKETEIEERGE